MFINSFQEKIWKDKYQYNNETFKEFCCRVASNIFPKSIRKRERLIKNMLEFKTLFGGRINSNIGVSEQGLTLFNCFIESTVKEPDSLEGIMDMVTKYALTLKTEGGVGFCANFLRPANTLIRKIGVTTPGAIKFLEIFDKVSEVITSGNVSKEDSFQGVPTKKSIRKGATMVTMNVNHPDIEEFITAKSIPNKLTKMNMSVLITDAFMYAVSNNLSWDLWFPDINCAKYDDEWDGNFEKWADKGYPTVVYNTVDANYLWELLLKSSFNRNEPGLLFIDTIRKMDNLEYLGSSISATNPCGEVVGNTGVVEYKGTLYELGDVCNLGSLVLPMYYNMKSEIFDNRAFKEDITLMVEALDNVIDISIYPLDMYEFASKMKRKIGVGIAGVGSLFMMMGIRYGSNESIRVLDNILSIFMNTLYQASAMLAKEKGPFELYSEKLLSNGYVANNEVLTKETIDLIKKYGLRNSALSAIAPNGTLAILAGNVSGGLEPVFSTEYSRWNRVEGRKVPFKYPNIHKGEWFETKYFKEESIADEKALFSTDGKYRIDKNQGLCEEVIIRDYGYNKALEYGKTEFTSAMELTVQEHLNVLKTFAKFIDLSVSKTINLQNGITFEDFKEVYNQIYKYGIKGCTTYREGTSVAVLESTKQKKIKSVKIQQKEFLDSFKGQENGDFFVDDVKLPEEYPAKGYILRSEGKKWYVHVAFKNKACTKPFAIFVNTNNREDNVTTYDALEKMEEIALAKGLKEHHIEEIKRKYAYQKNPVKICRMLGLLLRHNVPIYTIVQGFNELEGATIGTFVFRIKKFLAGYIKEYDVTGMVCPECGEKTIHFTEGCLTCYNCGYSKCG